MGNKTATEAETPKKGRGKDKGTRKPRSFKGLTPQKVIEQVFDAEALWDAAKTTLEVMRDGQSPKKTRLDCAREVLNRKLGLAVRQDQVGDRPIYLTIQASEDARDAIREAQALVGGKTDEEPDAPDEEGI